MPNFIAMLTFCDGEEPQVLDALKESGSVYNKIIPHVEEPWYYKFNNSAFFSPILMIHLLKCFGN